MAQWGFSTNGDEVIKAFGDRVKGKTSKCYRVSRVPKLTSIVVITGPSIGGIGAETALSLARGSPALIILAGRSASKAVPLISQIEEVNPAGSVKFVVTDLDAQVSVRKAAAEINASVEKIDYLINNAGIMACPYRKTEDGTESQFATNHVGHFLLTNLLMGKILKAGRGARIVNVGSVGHLVGMKWNWDFDVSAASHKYLSGQSQRE
jgi:NAD(P)-dependent dehydrogenase (short-subunit alcohol dehydrogenase family)